ncbi:acyl-CoA dehydrogenase FadE8 [Mycobacterium tuberculosis BTB11-214]|nr:acyl-CoA dehydrogenase FadE8 [Mycobacterium tuberculosis BTB07-325]KCO54801.1 acyl-CoA dehydrogenase FadE8 [Mycobacterium tuberculosis BTB08-022]KCQ72877.1 acyl-CoA dehydrogenase FadE8 [Mycobacterium tuberculosis BTB11-214]
MSDTHVVTNQVPPLENYNPASSPVLIEALIQEGGQWGLDEVNEVGAISASCQAQRWGELADRNRPILHTHDAYGYRVDEVEYDPAYHELMRTAITHGMHAAPWADDRPGAHVVRAAKTSVWTVEPGHICPISMTYAVVPALRYNSELAAVYEPLLTSREYDPELKPATTKAGITAGMSMTEKQGGSDVRAGTTQATPNADGSYSLTGHKWFTSAPMCDIFLVLAQAPDGLSCFLLPRVLPDGTRNRMFLQRLKDKRRGEGFCAGFDLSAYAEGSSSTGGGGAYQGTVLDGKTQAVNHLPNQPWDPMIDYQMMSRFVRGFASLMHADKPTVVKIHGYCVAGGTDIALHADQVIAAADAKIGYPPTRVWGVPAAGLWAHRLGDQRAKRLLFTGDCITGAQAAEWGLAVEAPEPADLDERTERLVARIAALPVNQLIMVKLALNSALLQQGVATSRMVSTVFDGAARHTPEGHAFVADAVEHGFRDAVRRRDEPFGDYGRQASRV